MSQEIRFLETSYFRVFFFGIKIWGFVPTLIDSFPLPFAPLVKGVGRRQGSWESFCGNVLLFWNAHTPPKGFFLLGIWEHLLASKMLLGKGKALS